MIRVFLAKLSKQELVIAMREERVEEILDLSPTAEKQYTQAKEDIKKGKNVTRTKNVDELLKLLEA